MGESRTLLRADRIKMFLNEYYFGSSSLISAIRIFGGPLLVLIGIDFYQGSYLYDRSNKLSIAYGGFCVLYGVYLILKPIFWILFRLDSFKTVKLSVEVYADRIRFKDEFSESEVLFVGFNKILKRKHYYALQLTKYNKIYLPFELLTIEQRSIIENNLK